MQLAITAETTTGAAYHQQLLKQVADKWDCKMFFTDRPEVFNISGNTVQEAVREYGEASEEINEVIKAADRMQAELEAFYQQRKKEIKNYVIKGYGRICQRRKLYKKKHRRIS